MNVLFYNYSKTEVTQSTLAKNEEFTINDTEYLTTTPEHSIDYKKVITNYPDKLRDYELFTFITEDVNRPYENNTQTLEAQNSSVNVFVDYSEDLLLFGAVCFIGFAIVGTIGNFISILALSMCKRLRNATTAFIVNLCVADLLFCSFLMPLSASTFIHKDWIYGNLLCIIFSLVRYSNGAVSLFSVIAITVNRYIIIVHPQMYQLVYTKRKITIMICLMWLFSPLFLLSPLLEIWGKLGYDPKVGTCTILAVNGKSPKTFLFIIAFIIPSIVFIVCYLKIYTVVRKRRKKTSRKEDKLSSSIISFTGKTGIIDKAYAQKRPYLRHRNIKELKILQVMLVVFLFFVLCYFPAFFVKILHKEHDLPILNVFGYIGVYFSSIINPLIYIVMSNAYRQAYKELFCPGRTRNISYYSECTECNVSHCRKHCETKF